MAQKFVQTLDLKSDPQLVKFYIDAHQPDKIWPEIVAGIRQVGITNMEIYRSGTRLTMIIEAPDDFDFQSAMDKLSKLHRQSEWESYVGKAQVCDENSTSAGKWQMMERIFNLMDCDSGK